MSRANITCLLDGPAQWAPTAPAVVDGDTPVHTWTGFRRAVAARAGGLRDRLGIRPGDSVALAASNCPEYLEALFAIWHAGGVAVPVSSRLHVREVAGLIADARATACYVTADLADGLAGAVDGSVALLVLDGEDADDPSRSAEPMAPVARDPGDDAWIFFTSGTTGRAKGARISHANLLAMTSAYLADVAPVSPRDSLLHVAALSHASGLFALPFVARGAAQVVPASRQLDIPELLDLVAAAERATFFVPPTVLRRLCAAPQLAETPVDRLGTVLVGAAPVLPDDLRTGVAALGPRLWNGYGQGETPLTITAMSTRAIADAIADGDDARLSSVGVARFATRVRVIGADGRPVDAGEVGEVVVDGPTVMRGYLDLPEATAAALRGGWLHTGDLGRLSPDGHLTLVDRAKDVVITGGYNVYPREVEDVLAGDPAVAESAVVGIPDAEWGERIVAFVVPRAGATLDTAALDRRCLERIARHKRPKDYVQVDTLPRNAAGKILKQALRDAHARSTGAAADAPR